AGLAAVECRVLRRELLEEVAPACVDHDDVTFPKRDVVHLEAGLQVGGGDDRARVEAWLLARGVRLQLARGLKYLDGVDHDTTRGERLQVLQTELGDVVLRDV